MLCCVLLFYHAAHASDFRFSPRPNKAHLIQWRTWGKEAFDEAQKEDKLILLSLSAVWCHWCHVMDETTYSDQEIITFINDNFIPVRVDADMRPDIDTLYNQGGWPSTAILTPRGEVISGGNYIPQEEMLGRLKRTVAFYNGNRDAVLERIEEIKAMKEFQNIGKEDTGAMDKVDLDFIVQILKGSFDDKYGGFGNGQKFPSPDSIDFLLSVYSKNKDEEIMRIVILTLDHMAKGAIFDQVEGGFFRYATKSDWSEPHYEKMLEVNAGLIRNYAEASQALGRKDYLRIVQKSSRFVQSKLFDASSGAFYGSQDADEGYFKKADRRGVKTPAVDRTAYADSSSLMISALVAAYEATGQRQYLDTAAKGATFLLTKLYATHDGVFHYYRDGAPHLPGLLVDHAVFGTAMLDLYNVTGEKKYLIAAKEIGRIIIDRFYDPGMKRFRMNLDSSSVMPVTAGVLAELNGNLANYRAIGFLSRLEFTGEYSSLKEARDAAVSTLSRAYGKFTPHAAAFGNALLWIIGEPVQITIIAERAEIGKFLPVINNIYVPEKSLTVLSPSADARDIKKHNYALKESVYLCAGKRCSAAISDPERLGRELKDLAGSLSSK